MRYAILLFLLAACAEPEPSVSPALSRELAQLVADIHGHVAQSAATETEIRDALASGDYARAMGMNEAEYAALSERMAMLAPRVEAELAEPSCDAAPDQEQIAHVLASIRPRYAARGDEVSCSNIPYYACLGWALATSFRLGWGALPAFGTQAYLCMCRFCSGGWVDTACQNRSNGG